MSERALRGLSLSAMSGATLVAVRRLLTVVRLVAEHGLQDVGSVVGAQGLVGLQAWGLPASGIEPGLLHWQVDLLPLSHHGSPRFLTSLKPFLYVYSTFVNENFSAYTKSQLYHILSCLYLGFLTT